MIFAICAALIVVAGVLFGLFWAITRTSPEEDYETEAFGDVPHIDQQQKLLQQELLHQRLALIDERIAAASSWGAELGALDEERIGIMRILGTRQ